MAQVVQSYSVFYYGGSEGYANARSQITLVGSSNSPLALIRFYDEKMQPPADEVLNNVINMYLPSAALINVLDILRNEKPVYIDFRQNRGLLMTAQEIVGEGE